MPTNETRDDGRWGRWLGAVWGGAPPARRFGLVLAVVAAGLLAMVACGGDEWRTARERREVKVEAKFAEQGKTFATEAERARAVAKKTKTEDFARTYLWWGGLVVGAGALALGLTARWWAPDDAGAPRRVPGAAPEASRRLVWTVLAMAMVAGFALRAPRMPLSLYNDEGYTFKRYVDGEFADSGSGTGGRPYERVPWVETVWGNIGGNNGVLFSVLARLSHDAWRGLADAPDGQINETAFRLPALLGGIAGIAATGLLAWRVGGAWAGGLAAFLCALHPWHIRFSTEGRGYGLVLLFAPLLLYCLLRALEERRWRWWLGFAALEWATMSAFPGSAYLLIGANVVAGIALLGQRRLRTGLVRLAVANLVAAGAFVLVYLPGLPLLIVNVHDVATSGKLSDTTWWEDQAAFFAFGIPWVNHNAPNAAAPAMATLQGPLANGLAWLWLTIGLAGIALGTARLAKRSTATAVVAIAALVGMPIAAVVTMVTGGFLHSWYTIYALPGIIFLAAVGLSGSTWPARSMAAAGLVGFVVIALGAWTTIRDEPKEDPKGVVRLIRGGVFPDYDTSRTVAVGLWTDALLYDPMLTILESEADLDAVLATARKEHKPLFVTYSREYLVAQVQPDLLARLQDSNRFELLRVFRSFSETQYDHRVYRALPE